MKLFELKFTPAVGQHREEFPYEAPGSVKFLSLVTEIAKKLSLNVDRIVITPISGSTLLTSDYNLPIEEIVNRFGVRFQILPKGVVGRG